MACALLGATCQVPKLIEIWYRQGYRRGERMLASFVTVADTQRSVRAERQFRYKFVEQPLSIVGKPLAILIETY
jgi:hypothetical protein